MRTKALLACITISFTVAVAFALSSGASTTRARTHGTRASGANGNRVLQREVLLVGGNLRLLIDLPAPSIDTTKNLPLSHRGTVSLVQHPASGIWLQLRQCESKGNYTTNDGNGYYGAYQFLPSTWRAIGFKGMPNSAPVAVQDRAARVLEALQGWRAWPQCAAALGLG